MSCELKKINAKDQILYAEQFICQKRKSHKGMCKMILNVEWWGVQK